LPDPKSISTQVEPSRTRYTAHVSSKRYRFSVSFSGRPAGENELRRYARFAGCLSTAAVAVRGGAAAAPADFKKLRRVGVGIVRTDCIACASAVAILAYSGCLAELGPLPPRARQAKPPAPPACANPLTSHNKPLIPVGGAGGFACLLAGTKSDSPVGLSTPYSLDAFISCTR
jgi:hypothetical protein